MLPALPLPLAQIPWQAQAQVPARAEEGPLAPKPLSALPADLQPLVRDLQRFGFRLQISAPPLRGAYGLFEAGSRRIWIAPISFELGIARQTFLHEAVHAVQSCPTGKVTPIGWRLPPMPPVVRQEIGGILTTRYHGHRVAEQEAFHLQGQPDAVAQLMQALRRRCGLPRPAAAPP
ncbi:hypothetical protein [Synechococcus sp. CS-1332]|uniref:hypothetical protein n=1 Tax=Synechococcus sp. CS-1332 TaxID=2847972 RepID=UPI00223AF8C6|nr:hypothetical protein [Synechococcus sp. CS-1332]MCT0207123.1 hypothetical protein [Synechococcus sp. CS-1332]